MNIVVLDEMTLSERQLEELRKMGNVIRYADNPGNDQEILERAVNADILIVGFTNISDEILCSLKKTRMIALWSTGYNQLNLEAARRNDIAVTNVRGYARNAVAELTIGLMLSVLRKITVACNDVKTSKALNWDRFSGSELTGKTLGIVGTGVIGKRVAEIATGFNMNILGYDPYPDHEFSSKTGLEYVGYDELLCKSDIVTLHLPLLKSTKNILDKSKLDQMKPNSVVINAARAGIVNQDDLCEVLANKSIGGAGLDDIILNTPSGKELMKMDNVVITPHIGFNTSEALISKMDLCIENIRSFIENNPINVLN
ncbi:D-3-phosphoglycerate dehydrogenase [Dethiosulfatibacter aminovorans DSM 17477]|uniref:D-3-phosphoglycerate dehydrogenase n=1 Tax=Dethiosulfatibacter aminovorans DSM 17477 TaxID=1121476 RepID=A0A1M6E4P9_9FIRM|nr:NAD(P)-dependent oxidoreductase [Dethiosulfatibacter aminovorans]SHI80411.1 D-3-phosphoglycerate dehydrogenase [Dethiosulfatibacter aminovorans DSM 17477]